MNENDAFYNALIDVAAWDKENTLDRFMNSDSLFKKFLYKFITTDGSYVKLRSSLVERDLENAKLYSHTLKGIAANLGLVNLFDVSNNILSLLREGNLEEALRYEDALGKQYDALRDSLVSSLVSKDEAQAAELDELVEKTFEGSLPAFIAAFARKTKLSQDEVDRLRAMIDGYEEKRP